MPDRLKLHASERLDLNDVVHGTRTNLRDEFRFALLRLFQGQEPGGTIWDGFYIERLDQTANPGKIRVVNGMALDRVCERVYKASGTIASPDNLFDTPGVSVVITLPGSSTTHQVEVEFVLSEGEEDSRAFWDATFNNASDPSGDLRPDGREIAEQVPTRFFPDWKITTRTDGVFSWPADLGIDGKTLRIPLATVPLVGGLVPSSLTEKASTTTLVTPTADLKVRVHNARLFQTTDNIAFVGKDGTPKLNGGATNVWGIASIDYVNNVITLNDDPTAGVPVVAATDSIQVVSSTSGVPREYIKEFRGFGATNDAREKFFSELEIATGIEPEALVADYQGLTPATYNAENNSTATGTEKSITDGPYRTDTRIHTFKGLTRTLEFVLAEMKHGPDFGNTQDGSTDYAVESWVGTHTTPELGTDPNNIPVGSLGEVGNARMHYPFGSGTERIQHDSLRKHLSAVRSHTITVGTGPNNPGDFHYEQGLANAMQFIFDNYSDGLKSGTLYIKNGQYRLNVASYSNLTDPLELPKGWSIVGESYGGVEITLPNNRRFVVHAGTDGTVLSTQGQQLRNLTFINDGTARDRSGVIIGVDADNVGVNGLGQPVMKVDSCVFINADGGTAPGSLLGFVRVAVDGTKTAADELQRREVEFSNCSFVTDSATGQRHFEWSNKTSGGVAGISATPVMPNVRFNNCQFTDLQSAGGTQYGCFFDVTNHTGTFAFKFDSCQFLGGGLRSATELDSWIYAEGDATNLPAIFLHITGCEFRSSRLIDDSGIISPLGGAIRYEDYMSGRLSISGCSFMGFQWGVNVVHGISSIKSCEFYQCAAGIMYGLEGDAGTPSVSINKTQVTSCNFNGVITTAAKGEAALYQTVGILFAGAAYSFNYGVVNTTTGDPANATTAKIAGCNFSEIGCGISAVPLNITVDSADDHVFIENLMVTGCTFYCIPGTAIDTGFTTAGSNEDNVVGSMYVSSCEFNWIMWDSHRDVFTNGGVYPVTLITTQHQIAVSCFASRIFITGNTFNLVGLSGYSNANIAYGNIFVGPRRFLAVIGNDPDSATKTVVVKGNTFVGYSNTATDAGTDGGATDPDDLASDTKNNVYQSWAGCFWLTSNYTDLRDVGVAVSITENTITGAYPTGNTGGQLTAADSAGQNGFWIGAARNQAVVGRLILKDNDFTFYKGQHGLYISYTDGVGTPTGTSRWQEIIVTNNSIKSFDAGTSATYQNGYPTTAIAGRVELIHIEGYYCRANYEGNGTGAPPGTAELPGVALTIPGIICSGNILNIEGNTPTTGALDFGLEDGQRSGILITYIVFAGLNISPNAIFRNNTFKNCSLTLGDNTSTELAYRYIVESNTFIGHLTGSPGTTSGRFRGIFAHNHVHGEEDDAADALPLDESSICTFKDNTIFNGTAIFRAGHTNSRTWIVDVIGYFLYLMNNTFYGRGNGENGDSGSTPLVRSCFDFMGGNITATPAADDKTFPGLGTNLEAWDNTVGNTGSNKAIIVTGNFFPGAVYGQNCLFGGTNVQDIGVQFTTVGATVYGTDPNVGFIVSSNFATNPAGTAPSGFADGLVLLKVQGTNIS